MSGTSPCSAATALPVSCMSSTLVYATGLGRKTPYIPDISGWDVFLGKTLHSTKHNSAADHKSPLCIMQPFKTIND